MTGTQVVRSTLNSNIPNTTNLAPLKQEIEKNVGVGVGLLINTGICAGLQRVRKLSASVSLGIRG